MHSLGFCVFLFGYSLFLVDFVANVVFLDVFFNFLFYILEGFCSCIGPSIYFFRKNLMLGRYEQEDLEELQEREEYNKNICKFKMFKIIKIKEKMN